MNTGNVNDTKRLRPIKEVYNFSKACLYCGKPLKVKDFCSQHHKKAYHLQITKQQEKQSSLYFNWYNSFHNTIIGKHLMQENRDLSKSRDAD